MPRCRNAARAGDRRRPTYPPRIPMPPCPFDDCSKGTLLALSLCPRGLVTDDSRRESKVVSWLRGQREGPTADRREFFCLARLEISSCRLARRDEGRIRSIFIRDFFSCCSRYLSSGLLLGVGWSTAPLVLGADLPDLHILLIRLANLQVFSHVGLQQIDWLPPRLSSEHRESSHPPASHQCADGSIIQAVWRDSMWRMKILQATALRSGEQSLEFSALQIFCRFFLLVPGTQEQQATWSLPRTVDGVEDGQAPQLFLAHRPQLLRCPCKGFPPWMLDNQH
ncbi:hypothetical protein IWZ01DRAFT_22790 [Phyllosticta capitalensis]